MEDLSKFRELEEEQLMEVSGGHDLSGNPEYQKLYQKYKQDIDAISSNRNLTNDEVIAACLKRREQFHKDRDALRATLSA